MTIERILGTDTGTDAFGKTDRNFVSIDAEKLPISHNTDILAHDDIRTQINNLAALVGLGGIIESGSNVNGRYAKFEDGTMICWHTPVIEGLSVAVGAIYNGSQYPFPATFIGSPVVFCGGVASTDSGSITGIALAVYRGGTYWQPQFKNTHSVTLTKVLNASLLAIGRWK